MKVLKRIILIMVVCIAILLIVYLCFFKNDKNVLSSIIEEDGDESNIEPIINENVEPVQNHTLFYAVSDCIQKYFDYISLDVTKIGLDIDIRANPDAKFAEMEQINTEQDKKEAIYSLLDEQYILEKSIDIDNVLDRIGSSNEVEFYATKMNYLDGKITKRYIVSGKIRDAEYKTHYKDVFFVVTVDNDQSTYMIRPLEEGNMDIDEIFVEAYNKNITNNGRNILKYSTYNDKEIVQKYFSYYKNIAFCDKEEIYNLFPKDYREKRFGSIENFEKYIDNIQKYDSDIYAKEYAVNTYENYKEYVCKDQYGNLYIFKEKNPMDITIELDTYTLGNEKFLQTYNSSNDQYRVAMNIDKWVQMLNNRDYRSAFNVLDETFRTTNFDNDVDKFEEYMRQYFPEHYKLEFGEFSEETGTYMQEIKLTDITEQDEREIVKTIYMELGESTDFVMSFNLTRH